MPGYTVTITRTRTIESTVEIEVTAKDEEAATTKAEERITKAQAKSMKALDEAFDWEESSDTDDFEYDASEA